MHLLREKPSKVAKQPVRQSPPQPSPALYDIIDTIDAARHKLASYVAQETVPEKKARGHMAHRDLTNVCRQLTVSQLGLSSLEYPFCAGGRASMLSDGVISTLL